MVSETSLNMRSGLGCGCSTPLKPPGRLRESNKKQLPVGSSHSAHSSKLVLQSLDGAGVKPAGRNSCLPAMQRQEEKPRSVSVQRKTSCKLTNSQKQAVVLNSAAPAAATGSLNFRNLVHPQLRGNSKAKSSGPLPWVGSSNCS